MYNNIFVQCHKMFTIRHFNLQEKGKRYAPIRPWHQFSDVAM